MSRKPAPVPSYRFHKATGQAVVTIRTPVGRRDVYLGVYNSPESRQEYARLVAELATPSGAAAPPTPSGAARGPTVDAVVLAYLRHAEQHYRGPDGNPTDEVRETRRAVLYLHKLYCHTDAAAFGPRALATVREAMVGAGWCRSLVNRRTDRIKRCFKWATAQELVPVTVHQALRTLGGLQRGRTAARESEPVKPVPVAHVEATLPFLTPHLQAAVRLQLLTGMRPGEACRLRLADVDRGGPLWFYRPGTHKTAHLGRDRVIPFGPRARAVLEAFVASRAVPEDAPLFSPARAREERFARLRADRKSKVQPSQQSRKRSVPKKAPAAAYTVHTYTTAVRKAAKKAGVPHWHPNRLRHTFATEVRKAHGLEAAQVLLGHARADVTQVYAEKNLALALKVAAEVG